jgi:hypothetical protein
VLEPRYLRSVVDLAQQGLQERQIKNFYTCDFETERRTAAVAYSRPNRVPAFL